MTPPHLKLNMNTFGSAIGGTINGGVGNNPFAESGTNFINCIFNGGNFWDAMGQSAAGLGVQAAEMAINSVFSAVGGGITSSISLAAEKAKNKASEVKIAKENKSAEAAAQQGAEQAEALINETNGNVANYNAQLNELIQTIQESQEIIAAKKEEMLENINQMQTLIDEYNKENEQRELLQNLINSENDESKKADLQKQLEASTQACVALAPTINELSIYINETKALVAAEIKKGQTNQELAANMQNEIVTLSETTQTNLDNTVVAANSKVVTHTNHAAQETATLNSNATMQKLQGEQMLAAAQAKNIIPGLGTAMGAVDTTVAHSLITTGTNGKLSAQQFAGLIQAFGSNYTNNYASVQSALPEVNTNITNFYSGVDNLTAMVEYNNEEGTVILETEVPVMEGQEKREGIETQVA